MAGKQGNAITVVHIPDDMWDELERRGNRPGVGGKGPYIKMLLREKFGTLDTESILGILDMEVVADPTAKVECSTCDAVSNAGDAYAVVTFSGPVRVICGTCRDELLQE